MFEETDGDFDWLTSSSFAKIRDFAMDVINSCPLLNMPEGVKLLNILSVSL
jgi:hypothetical protein